MTSDPLLYKIDDFNLYQFSRSNPLRYVDAVGLDVLDCVVACIEDNDPINLAVEAIIAQIAVGLWPKEMFAAIASALGDEKLANAIRFSANSGSRVTTMPKGLMTLLRTPNKTKLAWKALTKHVSRGVGPVLIAYGLALAAIEVNCTAYCCTAYWTGGLPYKPGDYNIATTTWNFYFGD